MGSAHDSRYFDPMAVPFRHETGSLDAVVLVHGWTGTPGHFRMLGDVLSSAGYTVAAPILPGHGTSLADLLRFGWRDWVGEVVTTCQDFVDEGRRLHLVGLSMGGAIGLLAAPVMGAASLSVINVPLEVKSRRMWMATMFRGSTRVLEDDPRVPPDDEALPYFQQYDGTPVGSIADLRDITRAARRNLGAVTCPALVVQSLRDEIVKPESGRVVYAGISSVDKEMLWLRESRHNALVDGERDVIHEAIKGRISNIR